MRSSFLIHFEQAAKMGRSSCVQMLLSRFFTQPTSNTRGSSREYKSLTEEEKLISINRPDSNGSTPLHLASFFGNQDVIEILLAANADVHAKMNQGR
jgi:ankyrin repeat protein